MPHLSVVIPVYRAAGCIEELHRRLVASLSSIHNDFEIVLVEDFGQDGSWEIIMRLCAHDERVKGIQLNRNYGQHYALTAGLDTCDGDWVVIMDCDLQDRPEDIASLYDKAQEGYSVVLARRKSRKLPFVRRILTKLFYMAFRYFSGFQYNSEVGGFRIMSRAVVDGFRQCREQLRFMNGLVEWMGFPTAYVDVKRDPRFEGTTSYTFRRLFSLAFDATIANSDKPLRLSIKLGLSMSFITLLIGLVLLVRAFFFASPVTGWASLIVSLFFLFGIVIFNLGVLGIYIGKIFDEAKRRPLYFVLHRHNFDS